MTIYLRLDAPYLPGRRTRFGGTVNRVTGSTIAPRADDLASRFSSQHRHGTRDGMLPWHDHWWQQTSMDQRAYLPRLDNWLTFGQWPDARLVCS
jgi:hypothetical protein